MEIIRGTFFSRTVFPAAVQMRILLPLLPFFSLPRKKILRHFHVNYFFGGLIDFEVRFRVAQTGGGGPEEKRQAWEKKIFFQRKTILGGNF